MRVTLVSQYYKPEIGATQNRMSAFAEGLRARGHEVTVIAEQPNHPAGVYAPGWGSRPLVTELGDITVHRLWVATSPRKTTARRLAFYGSFAVGALAASIATARPDVVFCTSPPLPGAWAAAVAARAQRVPYILDVRDLWPAAASALGELSNARMIRALERVERWLYRSAGGVTATTRPFCRHIDAIASRPVAHHLPNGALDALLELPARPPPPKGFVVGYAGNLGIAQGLGIVLDAAALLRDTQVRFRLVGAGPLREELERQIANLRLDNVTLEPPVPTERIGHFLQSCHALLVPLRDQPLLGDFIPSKVYDAMAVGRPVICAAGREAAELVEATGCGVVVPPEDGSALAAEITALADDPARVDRLGRAGRAAAPQHVRSRQVGRLHEILQTAVRSEARRRVAAPRAA